MKIGVITSLWGSAGIPVGESIKRAARSKIRYVDVFARNQADPRFLSDVEKREIARIAVDQGIQVNGVVSLFPANSARSDQKTKESNWQYMMGCMDFAQELGAENLTYLSGEREYDLPFQTAWENSIHFARVCSEEARSRGLILVLECEPTVCSLTHDVAAILAYIKAVASPAFRFNMDTGHLHCMRASLQEIQSLAPYTVHVHLSDNRGLVDSHDIIGTGNCPNRDYLRAIADVAFARAEKDGVATLEINFGAIPPLVRVDPEEALRISLQWCEAHLSDILR